MKYLTLLFFIINFSIYGQNNGRKDGSIFLSNGKVLKGYCRLSTVYAGIQRKKPRVYYWKKNKGGKKETYKAREVDSIIFSNSEVIYSLNVDKPCEKAFFFIIYDDKVPLVAFNMVRAAGANGGFITPGYTSNEFWIWKKEKNKAFPLKPRYSHTKSFKGCVRDYLSECPSLINNYKIKELKNMDIIELVKLYNNCIE